VIVRRERYAGRPLIGPSAAAGEPFGYALVSVPPMRAAIT